MSVNVPTVRCVCCACCSSVDLRLALQGHPDTYPNITKTTRLWVHKYGAWDWISHRSLRRAVI